MSVPRELTLQKHQRQNRTDLPAGRPAAVTPPGATVCRPHPACSTAPAPSKAWEAAGDTVEIVAEFKAKDADQFGVNVRTGNGQRTTVGYDVARGGSTSTAPSPVTWASTQHSPASTSRRYR